MKKYYVLVGEASGDMHASKLIKELLKINSKSQFRGFGGDLMASEGMILTKHYRELAFMGFWEVIKNIVVILKNFKIAKNDILKFKPDVLILVDYPGFNMRMASFAKKYNIKVIYYITPQVWAWKQSRVKSLKRNVDLLIPILPFEKDFFKYHQLEAHFLGHPLLDELVGKKKNSLDTEKPIIALLPGSRRQEIKAMLPIMIEMVEVFKDYQFVIAGAPSIPTEFYRALTKDSNIPISTNKTYELLSSARAAIITSGTATLEAAILRVPQVVCYKTSTFSYILGRLLVKLKYISLVNLISDSFVVEELIQSDCNKENLKNSLNKILKKKSKELMIKKYNLLIKKLGEKGATRRVAELISSR